MNHIKPSQIAAVHNSDGVHFTLHIRDMGPKTFTSSVGGLAHMEKSQLQQQPVTILGPYGNLTVDLARYECIIFVSGGIGVTPNASRLGWILELVESKQHQATLP